MILNGNRDVPLLYPVRPEMEPNNRGGRKRRCPSLNIILCNLDLCIWEPSSVVPRFISLTFESSRHLQFLAFSLSFSYLSPPSPPCLVRLLPSSTSRRPNGLNDTHDTHDTHDTRDHHDTHDTYDTIPTTPPPREPPATTDDS